MLKWPHACIKLSRLSVLLCGKIVLNVLLRNFFLLLFQFYIISLLLCLWWLIVRGFEKEFYFFYYWCYGHRQWNSKNHMNWYVYCLILSLNYVTKIIVFINRIRKLLKHQLLFDFKEWTDIRTGIKRLMEQFFCKCTWNTAHEVPQEFLINLNQIIIVRTFLLQKMMKRRQKSLKIKGWLMTLSFSSVIITFLGYFGFEVKMLYYRLLLVCLFYGL